LLSRSQGRFRVPRPRRNYTTSRLARGLLVSLYLFALIGCQGVAAAGPRQNQRPDPTGPAESSIGSSPTSANAATGAQPTAYATAAAPRPTPYPSPVAPPAILVGESRVAAGGAKIPVGTAQAFQYVAGATGLANEIRLYLDRANAASQILVGLYTNSPANHPGLLLAHGRIDSPRSGTWNTVSVAPVGLTSGEKYWLTVLAPFGTDAVQAGLAASTGLAEFNQKTPLKQLVSTWLPGGPQSHGLIAAYVLASGSGAPAISSVNVVRANGDTATVSWTTDRPATSQMRYGTTVDYGDESVVDPTLVVDHTQVLGGLSPNTRYYFQVVSTDPNGRSASENGTLLTAAGSSDAARMGEWSSVMPWPLVDVHMSLLRTGEVLMWDAWEYNGTPSVHLWNPNSQSWSPTFQSLPSLPTASSQMFCADQVMLSDGRILVVGGHNGADIGIKNTMIFDPSTRDWTPVPDLNTARWYPSSIGLPDGRVLTLGGEITPGKFADVPELYDPSRNAWQEMPGAVLSLGEYPFVYLLPNGRIFVASDDEKSRTLNLVTQEWTTLGVTPAPTGTAAMYRPGKILVSGGGTHSADPVQAIAATIDLNQPSPAWTPTAPMNEPRYKHNLVVLADGTVLAAGGSSKYSLISETGVLDAELWNPDTGSWTLVAPMHDLRMYHSTALLLPDGRVLVAGGGRMDPVTDYQTAEIYSPPYLFKGPRPTITAAPGSAALGTTLAIQTNEAARIKSVALVRLGSVTHTYDSDQRYVNLDFAQTRGGLEARTPTNSNVAPPGYYMLFIVDASGVPSVAKIVRLT
jgi:hypothetical protein